MARLKRIISIGFVFATLFSCTSKNVENKPIALKPVNKNDVHSNSISTSNMPIIKFEKELHDFGRIFQSEKVSYTFKFKNIGLSDLIIKEAKATCGCTVPKYSKEPIPSGGEGEIEVTFDSNNRVGRQVKTITVWTNCQPDQNKLEIVSEIVVPN